MAEINIERLIAVVNQGGAVCTGIDVYNDSGVLMLEKDVRINSVTPLMIIKRFGVESVPIVAESGGGVWDHQGKEISQGWDRGAGEPGNGNGSTRKKFSTLEQKVEEIVHVKAEADRKFVAAKEVAKKTIEDIRQHEGCFEFDQIEQSVGDLTKFLAENEHAVTGLAHMSREIFSYDEYLFNHSVNVCTLATAILRRFNEHFGEVVNRYLTSLGGPGSDRPDPENRTFVFYLPDEIHHIAVGYYLHDIGKVLIPEELLNRAGRLNAEEYDLVKRHSYDYGAKILKKNGISNPFIENCVIYHHAPLFVGEERSYPLDRKPHELAPYIKICKLADGYDAMTSRRAYREASNPIEVVTSIFRGYSQSNRMLQFLLFSFIQVVGIYPPGSVIFLLNGQMAYVLDSNGPLILPFTDTEGEPLRNGAEPIDLGDKSVPEDFHIDRHRPLKSPREVFEKLPAFLRKTA